MSSRIFATSAVLLALAGATGLSAVATGCSKVNSAADVPLGRMRGEGLSSTYDVAPDEAWTIARAILEDSKPKGVEEQKAQSFMLATYPMKFAKSYGQAYFGVWTEAAEGGKTKVTALLKTQSPNDPAKPITEEEFQFRMGERVKAKGGAAPTPKP